MGQGGWIYLLLLVLFFGFITLRGRRQQRTILAVQDQVQVGAEVMMTSGVYGTVVAVGDDGVIDVELAPGLRTRWQRQAVARVVEPDPPGTVEPADETDQPSS